MLSIKEIKLEKEFLEKIYKQYKTKLKKLPKGRIYYKKEHGKKRTYIYEAGKEHYLSSNKSELINALKKKSELERAITYIEENIRLLSQMELAYRNTIDCLVEEDEIRNKHETFRECGLKNSYRPENKIHITSKGVKVRSKSELIIATFLEAKEIEFKYEAHLNLGGRNIYPDFMIIRKSDGKLIVWEHFGMMDDEGYRKKAFEKIQNYIENGYIPYDNLIITFGDGDSGIDMSIIETIVETMLR